MADLKIFLLGTPRIEHHGQTIRIRRKKALALLAYLAATNHQHHRDWLSTLLWPDAKDGRTQLRIVLSTLRKAIGDERLLTINDEIGLKRNLWVDTRHFQNLVDEVDKSLLTKQERTRLIDEAITLYVHNFLAGFTITDALEFEQWQRVEEERLQNQFERLLQERIHSLIGQGDFETAVEQVYRLIQLDALNESAYRDLMSIYVWSDQRHKALEAYAEFKQLLHQKWGIEPDTETQALYQTIQQEKVIPLPDHVVADTGANHSTSYYIPAIPPAIGRKAEVEKIIRLLSGQSRLVTITGVSGIGKTHVAITVANHMKHQFTDGCYFIKITTNVSADFFISTLLDILQLRGITSNDNKQVLLNALIDKEILLVVDDFHRVENGVEILRTILQVAQGVRFLLTAYDTLNLKREHYFPLHGLSFNKADSGLSISPAFDLFIQQAKRVQPDFTLNAENRRAINRICKLLQGMPLAIILAAAWSDIFTPQTLAEKIEANYEFLHVDYLDLPPRHRSIRVVLDNIWEQHSEHERVALMGLSVFQGGFTFDAAATVCGTTVKTLKQLITRSTVYHDVANNRYTIHDILRHYAHDKLATEADASNIHEAHCRYYLNLVVSYAATIKGHMQHKAWPALDNDLSNIQAAWRYSLQAELYDALIPMIEPFRIYLQQRSLWDIGRELFEAARRKTSGSQSVAGKQVYMRTVTRLYLNHHDTKAKLDTALKMAVTFGDKLETANAHAELGWYDLNDGDFSQAKIRFEAAIALYEELEEFFSLALIYRGLAYAMIALGDIEQAMQCMRQSLSHRQIIGDLVGEYETRVLRAELFLHKGNLEMAQKDFQETFKFYASIHGTLLAHYQCIGQSWLYVFSGKFNEALKFVQKLITPESQHIMPVARSIGVAVMALVYLLQNNRSKALYYSEELDVLLSARFRWDSNPNPDLVFYVFYSHAITKHMLGQNEEATTIIQNMFLNPMFTSPDRLYWLCPLLIMLAADHSDISTDLTRIFKSSELSNLSWFHYWTKLQTIIQHGSDDDTQSKRDDAKKILAAASKLGLRKP